MDVDEGRLVIDPRRLKTGDVLIGVSVLALVIAGALPTLRAHAFERQVEAAAADVEILRGAAIGQLQVLGRWPPAAGRGQIPRGVSGAFPGDSTLIRRGYSLEWTTWELVDRVEAPFVAAAPTVGGDAPPPDSVSPATMPIVREVAGVVVHSADESLLAELLARYGADVSFVRDSTWTLVVRRPDE